MAIVGSILFLFYAVVAVVAMGVFGWPLWLVLLGNVLFVGVQYGVGKWAALRSVGAEDVPEEQFRKSTGACRASRRTWASRSRGS